MVKYMMKLSHDTHFPLMQDRLKELNPGAYGDPHLYDLNVWKEFCPADLGRKYGVEASRLTLET